MSSKIGFQIKQDHSIVLFIDGKLHTIGKDDINFPIVLEAIKTEKWDTVRRTINVRQVIADHADGRVEIFGEEIYIDKKKLPDGVTRRVLPVLKANDFNLKPLFRLLENIEKNPEAFSREELYLFLNHNDLPITNDGHFLAYKMVRSDYKDIYTGTLDNSVGKVVQMDRTDVDPNRNRTCSKGLHFCSYDYIPQAYHTGSNPEYRLLVLKINPADVVSIPSDYNNSKGRCWRYEVVDELLDFSDKLDKGYTKDHSTTVDEVDESDDKAEFSDVDYSKKLDATKVHEIRRLLKTDLTLADIARKMHVSARQVARIRDGEAWTNVK